MLARAHLQVTTKSKPKQSRASWRDAGQSTNRLHRDHSARAGSLGHASQSEEEPVPLEKPRKGKGDSGKEGRLRPSTEHSTCVLSDCANLTLRLPPEAAQRERR